MKLLSSGGGGYWESVPTGGFSADTAATDSVSPFIDVSGTGYVETIKLISSSSNARAEITLEIDGVMILDPLHIWSGMQVSVEEAFVPIKFKQSVKCWLNVLYGTDAHVLINGRLI